MNLEPGKTYRFLHCRKGIFVARFLGMEATEPGNAEPFFARVEIQTDAGSGQERLANMVNGESQPPEWTDKLLLPSLIEATCIANDLPPRAENPKENWLDAVRKKWAELMTKGA